MNTTTTANNVNDNNIGGFTLIEILLALAIFSIGVLAIAGLQITATNGDTRARFATEAAALAQNQAEQLLSLTYDTGNISEAFIATDAGNSSFDNFPTDRAYDVHRYTVDWIVDPNPTTGAVTITVRTVWRVFGVTKRYELQFVKNEEI